MPKAFSGGVNRIIDANINRAKEGLRVCEEIVRFVMFNQSLTAQFKKTRHQIDSAVNALPVGRVRLLNYRQSLDDAGRTIHSGELKRQNIQDVFLANIQRVKESIRVLEEFLKLTDKNSALRFKKIRYSVYEIEKKAARKLPSLRNIG